jgi:hypothetical protein
MHAKTGEIVGEKYGDHNPESLEQLNADKGEHFSEVDYIGVV